MLDAVERHRRHVRLLTGEMDMQRMKKGMLALVLATLSAAASAQSGSWQFPLLSPKVGQVGTILVPGERWSAGTPLDGYAAEEPLTIVQKFYQALAAGDLTAATALICAGDRPAFAGADAQNLVQYLQTYPTRERVGIIQYPTLDLVFIRLVSPSGAILRAIEVLPPAADPILNVYPAPPRRTSSCITQLDEAGAALRDMLAQTMPELHDPSFPNPFPNGLPDKP